MRHIKLTIAYDGAGYSGWQIQPNATTIQELIQKAVREMTGEKINVVGSGRTDAGVHALGQVASFRTEKTIPLEGFRKGINNLLPKDIRILNAEEVEDGFHPIRNSKRKNYRYIITSDEFAHPLEVGRVWAIGRELDIDAMNKACEYLVGEHDFSSFRAADAHESDAIRKIFIVNFKRENKCYIFDISGSGFLKNMVRNIVGTLYDVGIGKISPDKFKDILEAKDRKKAGVCAPASGLYLISVEY